MLIQYDGLDPVADCLLSGATPAEVTVTEFVGDNQWIDHWPADEDTVTLEG